MSTIAWQARATSVHQALLCRLEGVPEFADEDPDRRGCVWGRVCDHIEVTLTPRS